MRKTRRMRMADVRLHDCKGNFLYCISHADGNAMVNAGLAVAVREFSYGQSRVKRYQETAGATASSSSNSMPVITVSEMQANVMHSGTVCLPEWDTKGRDSKHARMLANDPEQPAEDFVEQAQNKIRMWQRVPLWNPKRVAWSGNTRTVEA
jgi:hypothetical protein